MNNANNSKFYLAGESRKDIIESCKNAINTIAGYNFEPENMSNKELREVWDTLTACANELDDLA